MELPNEIWVIIYKHVRRMLYKEVLTEMEVKINNMKIFLNEEQIINEYMMKDSTNYITDTNGFKYCYNDNIWLIDYLETGGIHDSNIR